MSSPTIVTPNTTWASSSWYILQDYLNRKYILTGPKDDFLKGQLMAANMDRNYNTSFTAANSTGVAGISGPKLGYNDSFFTDANIKFTNTNTFDSVKYTQLINLQTPLGYVEVKWSNADKNLDRTEATSPKMNGDVTVNISKLTGAAINTPVFLFMTAGLTTDPINMFRLYKKKNNADFDAEITNEQNYINPKTGIAGALTNLYNGVSNLVNKCNSDNYRSPGCSASILNNKTIVGKLRYTLYNGITDYNTVLNYGYCTLQDMQSSNHFKDYLGNYVVGVCVYEGFISLPYTNTYTFQATHDDLILVTLNGTDIINGTQCCGPTVSNSYTMDAGTYTLKIKLTNTAGPGSMNIQYKTVVNPNFVDIPTSWFSVTYFVNMSDYLQNIYNIQNDFCSNNLNNPWCQNMAKISSNDSSSIYKKYCLTNSKYQTDYNTCINYYTEGTNDLTDTVKTYCTDNSRLFNTSCISGVSANPSYLGVPIWEAKKKYCDNTKFTTDTNCQNTIKDINNISVFDKLLGDNCSSDKLTTEPCKTATTMATSATDFTKVPYFTFKNLKNCIKTDGTLDLNIQFCKDTANDIYSKKGAYLMEPVMNYCKGTTTTNGTTTNNITTDFCTNYINAHKCNTSAFTANREEEEETANNYYNWILLILIIIVISVILKLNFKIDNIYKEYSEVENEGR